jgi:hypothetical protein
LLETQSYFPEVAYRYGYHTDAYAALQHLFSPTLSRREYPEVSYGVLDAIVRGMIGLSAQADHGRLVTISRLDDHISWVAVDDLPVLDNRIELCHIGNVETQLFNKQGRRSSGKHVSAVVTRRSYTRIQSCRLHAAFPTMDRRSPGSRLVFPWARRVPFAVSTARRMSVLGWMVGQDAYK